LKAAGEKAKRSGQGIRTQKKGRKHVKNDLGNNRRWEEKGQICLGDLEQKKAGKTENNDKGTRR